MFHLIYPDIEIFIKLVNRASFFYLKKIWGNPIVMAQAVSRVWFNSCISISLFPLFPMRIHIDLVWGHEIGFVRKTLVLIRVYGQQIHRCLAAVFHGLFQQTRGHIVSRTELQCLFKMQMNRWAHESVSLPRGTLHTDSRQICARCNQRYTLW